MRVLGQAVTRIEPSQARRLSEIGKIYCGDEFSINAGTYELHIRRNIDTTIDIILKQYPESSGGAHELFWKKFSIAFDELAAEIATDDDPGAMVAISRLGELKSILTSGGRRGTWLSAIRNEINYQHAHGVWFPLDVAKKDKKYISTLSYRCSSSLRLDYDAVKNPLIAFSAGSLFLASLNIEASEQLISRADAERAPFGRAWKKFGELCKAPRNSRD